MKRLQNKLADTRGETLVELLASILIATLSVGLLLGGVAVSAHLARQADQADAYFYQTLTAAETRLEPVTEGVAPAPTVQVTENGSTIKIPVQIYGDTGLYAYARYAAEGDEP